LGELYPLDNKSGQLISMRNKTLLCNFLRLIYLEVSEGEDAQAGVIELERFDVSFTICTVYR